MATTRNAGKKAPAKKKIVVDDKKYLCPSCMTEKKKSEFYNTQKSEDRL